ncbi:hypothetical protein D9M68_348810 [compost metagenome]
MLEVAQLQRAQLPVALALQQRLGLFPLFGRDERHRRLRRQADLPGTVVGRQPERDFRARRGVAPVPGQDEALFQFHRCNLEMLVMRPFYPLAPPV